MLDSNLGNGMNKNKKNLIIILWALIIMIVTILLAIQAYFLIENLKNKEAAVLVKNIIYLRVIGFFIFGISSLFVLKKCIENYERKKKPKW
jgi:Na+-driven multidrug efflux pump